MGRGGDLVMLLAALACDSGPDHGGQREGLPSATVTLVDDGPWDGDLDGYGDDVDCDDDNAAVHPGAPELCDDADQDCDGEGWAGGACAGEQDVAAMGVKLTGTIYGFPEVVRDVTGDGVADIMDGHSSFDMQVSGYGYWTATDIPGHPGNFPDDATQAAFYVSIDGISHTGDFGDVDGDGFNDAGIAGEGILLARGPIPTDGSSTNQFDYEWYSGVGDGGWYGSTASGDFNGDGLGDAAASVYDSWMNECPDCAEGQGGVYVFWGGTFGDEHTQIGDWNSGDLWRVGDITGDGIDDLVVEDPDGSRGLRGSVAWVNGLDLATAPESGGWMTDLAYATWYDETGRSSGWFPIGDLDGDGAVELLTNFVADDADDERDLLVYSGDRKGELSAADAAGGWTLTGDAAEFTYSWADRCSGNLLLSNQTYLFVLPPPLTIPALRSELPSQLVSVTHSESGFPTYDCGDVTGEGTDDLVYGLPQDGSEIAQIRIIPDWSIPWDDPTYW